MNKIIGFNTRITLKNTFYVSAAEIFSKVLGFFWILFLARNLTIAEYGTYNYVNAFILLFALIPDLGTGLIIIREIAKNPKKTPLILGNTFYINILFSFFAFLLILFVAFVFGVNEEIKLLLIISSFTLFLSILRSIGIFYFEGTERMKSSALLTAINTLFLIGGGFIGLSIHGSLFGVFSGMLIGTMISLLITWLFVRKYVVPVFHFNKSIFKYLIKSGIPLGIAGFATILYLRIDTIMIGQLLDQEAVGVYSAATPLVLALSQLIFFPFIVAVFPVLTRLHKTSFYRFNTGILKSILLILLVTIPLTIVVFIFSGVLIEKMFGSKYINSIPVLKILILYLPFFALSSFLYRILIILNKQTIYLLITIFGFSLSVLLNLLLIPKFYLFGAAYASVLTQVLLFIIYLIFAIVYLQKERASDVE